jgi:glycosyltransferase involved in cell wall biosynthesis
MKLLFLIHSLASGGAERVTTNLANHWAAGGASVTVVTIAGFALDHYQIDPSIRRVALSLDSHSGGILAALVGNLRRVRAIRRVLKQIRPDVAIAMMTQSNVLLAMAALGVRGIRTIGSERSHPPQMPVGRIWQVLRSYWYGKLGAVIALTSETRDWLAAHTSSRNIATIPNPVPWPFPRQPPLVTFNVAAGGTQRVLLAVGRLSEEKGFHILIECFARLAPSHSDWQLVIIGQGPERAELEHLVAQHGITDRVRLPGLAGNVGDWYQGADLYVMTSRFEGFPNTLAEAMAHGLPAVSFDCDTGPRDIIRNEYDGLLVKDGDAAALERALSRLMGDDVLRARFAERASDARERFSPASIVKKWERLFDAVERS